MAALKKQLEEREKQLAAEQEDASAAKNRLRELTKVRCASGAKISKSSASNTVWFVAVLAFLENSLTRSTWK